MFRLLTVILTLLIICTANTFSVAAPLSMVKTTETDKYTRLIFYCKQPVTFSTNINGSNLKISFKNDINIDAASINESGSTDIKSAAYNSKNNTATITLASEDYKIRKFIGEDFVGVDILKDPKSEPKKTVELKTQIVADATSTNPTERTPTENLPIEMIPAESTIEPSAGADEESPAPVKLFNMENSQEEISKVKIPEPTIDIAQEEKEIVAIEEFIPVPKLKRVFVETAATPEEKPEEKITATQKPPVAEATKKADVKTPATVTVPAEMVNTQSTIPTAPEQTPANKPTTEAVASPLAAASNTPASAVNNGSMVTPEASQKTETTPIALPQPAAPVLTATPAQEAAVPANAEIKPSSEKAEIIAAQAETPTEEPAEEKIAEDESAPEVVIPIADKVKDNLLSKLVFDWDSPVAASVFKRAGYLWIVFDKAKEINVPGLIMNNPEYFSKGEQMPNRFYTILRMKLRGNFNTVAFKEKDNWVIGFTKTPFALENTSTIDTKSNELTGSQIILSDIGKTKPLRLIDPEVGDEIITLPYLKESSGIKEKYKYVDFAFLETIQGGAIQVISDDVNMELSSNSITITGPANRIASKSSLAELREKEEEAKQKAERLKQQNTELTMIKFNSWMLGAENEYKKNLHELEWKITEVNWSEKNTYRLALARFYFANGMEAEALGVIKAIKDSDTKLGNENDVKMLEATALYLMGRYNESAIIYDTIDLAKLSAPHRDEVNFWHNAANININNQVKADKFITNNPLKKENSEEDGVGQDKVGNTKLMRDTSMRLLKMIRKMDPDFVNAEELQKLEATTRFVTGHYQEAIKRFEETDLYSSGDVFQAEDNKLWWSAEAASENKRNDVAELPLLNNLDGFLKNYPVNILNNFALLAVEDALKRNDLARAEEILAAFKDENRFVEKNSIEFFRGLYYAKNEEDNKALEVWDNLITEIGDPYNRARAQFASTILKLDKKKINAKQAIANLNSIRNLWRGGQLEFHVLNLLGEFYMETGQPMEGFRVWKEAVSAFPGSDESLLIAKKMSQQFVKIFSQGEADKMPQIDAITLYYEFRELTPIGKQGDDMISNLIDRLTDVDLLDRAAALLTHQVRFRLSGEERDVASTKLVRIHMINHDPQKAIDVLDATESDKISPEITTTRRYLRAQALLDLGKNNKVITLLQDDNSTNAAFLRADVYWNNGVWRKVVDELEVPFRELRRDEKRLNIEETNQLIKLAVSYALIDRQKRLQVLYEDFAGFIDDPNKKSLLTFIATNKGAVDYKNLEQTVGYKDMENFLNNYMKPPEVQGNSS